MAAEFDLEQTDRLLATTRAVRKRLDLTRPVEREVVLDCLRIAQQAPSGRNRQRGRWLVVRDEAKKKAIADLYTRSYEAYITPQLAVLDPEDSASVRIVVEEWHAVIPHYRIASDELLQERGGQLALLALPLAWDVDEGATP